MKVDGKVISKKERKETKIGKKKCGIKKRLFPVIYRGELQNLHHGGGMVGGLVLLFKLT